MKRKTLLITLVALLVAGTAFAGKGLKNARPGYMNEGLMNKMHAMQILTEEEQGKVEKAKLDFEKKAIPLRAEARVLQMEINELVLAGKSEKDIAAKLTKKNEVQATLAKERLKHQIEVRSIVGEEKYQRYNRQHVMPMGRNERRGDGMRGKSYCTRNFDGRRPGNYDPRWK